LSRVVLAALACALLAGCRAVVGIDELRLEDASAAAPSDAGADARDAGPPPDSGCGPSDHACRKRCRDNNAGANPLLETELKNRGCICGAGACATECASTVCSGGAPDGGPAQCPPCMDDLIKCLPPGPACRDALTTCRGNPACKPLLDCFEACP
jgi:hypothetical protein